MLFNRIITFFSALPPALRTLLKGVMLLAVGLALLFAATRGVFYSSASYEDNQQLPMASIAIETSRGVYNFEVEMATTPASQKTGLMHRTSLPANQGMWFMFSTSGDIPKMWMKNTLISLDMLFLDEQNRVVHIARRTTPGSEETIAPPLPASSVIELNAGTADRIGLEVGDTVYTADDTDNAATSDSPDSTSPPAP